MQEALREQLQPMRDIQQLLDDVPQPDTIRSSLEELDQGLGRVRLEVDGMNAFKLHDTYGFPIDLTQIMAEEKKLRVDIGEYERLMAEARERARGAGKLAHRLPPQRPDRAKHWHCQTIEGQHFRSRPGG